MSIPLGDKIHSILSALEKHRVPLDKVVLHKFFYFLQAHHLNLGMRFEPWKYGPYSFDLAKNLEELVFWGDLSLHENTFNINKCDIQKGEPLTSEELKHLEKSIAEFVRMTNNDYSFNNLEIVGTILYCASSLTANGIAPDAQSIANEFVAWKGPKYPLPEIHKHILHINKVLSN